MINGCAIPPDEIQAVKQEAKTLHFQDILETMILSEFGDVCKKCNLINCPVTHQKNEANRTSFGPVSSNKF